MSKQKAKGRFDILEGFPADVLAIEAHGLIDREAYEKTLMPLVAERIGREGRIKLLYIIGQDFEGFTAGAAWDDARLGLLHPGDFARIAVVTDVEWVRFGVKLFAPLMRGRVRLFGLGELEEARNWICMNRPEEDEQAILVAADYKILPLEDKLPPEPEGRRKFPSV